MKRIARNQAARLQANDQAHPPPEAGATGGTTKAQAVSDRVQRLVRLMYGASADFTLLC